jgi:hypothetical protein
MVKPPLDIDSLSPLMLKPLTLELLEENGRLASACRRRLALSSAINRLSIFPGHSYR